MEQILSLSCSRRPRNIRAHLLLPSLESVQLGDSRTELPPATVCWLSAGGEVPPRELNEGEAARYSDIDLGLPRLPEPVAAATVVEPPVDQLPSHPTSPLITAFGMSICSRALFTSESLPSSTLLLRNACCLPAAFTGRHSNPSLTMASLTAKTCDSSTCVRRA